ncbi:MAG: DUF4375 domain-containing protein [Agathobacter sp.]|nr:DUF4375 domain-containing protein [Agathobacter sp.]
MGFLGTILYNIKNMKKAQNIRNMNMDDLLALDDDNFFDAIECVCEDAVYDINAPELTEAQIFVYSLNRFEAEVNNGGLCQFFVNSSSECAPYISKALDAIGANDLKTLFDRFIEENNIDVTDLSSFKIDDVSQYEEQTERFDFDSFDEKFYMSYDFHRQIITYARKNIEQIIK